MKKFRKLNLPKRHTVHAGTPYSKVKWFCSVEGSEVYYLHDDLHIHYGATTDELPEDSYHTGFFDSEEEALTAYEKYYYLHAQEPGH